MKLMMQCLLSPRLYKIYKETPRESMYQPNTCEKWGDKLISMTNTIWNIGLYTSPFVCLYIYKTGMGSYEEAKSMIRLIGCVGCLLAMSFLVRAFGRATNPKYTEFLKALNTNSKDPKIYMESIRKYDFDFYYWPVTYAVQPENRSWELKHPFQRCANPEMPLLKRMFIQTLAFIATHTFALRLIYPGSLGLIHMLLGDALTQGRGQLVEQYNGQRSKVGTADGNSIDTMFIDNRLRSPNGKTLVVCCEGNSGFYEVGIVTTPVKAGYSALGWNHPGFATSTGLPYPSQEHKAIDAVMQFAIEELGFKPNDIVLYGWSIGGYTATWAAQNYPDIKALILDATFDDILPLAQKQMPESWTNLVKEVVRSHVNLNISEMMLQYNGPVKLVRRTEDEIICLNQGQLASNRANNLLLKVIEARHPDDYTKFVTSLYKYVGLVDSQRAAILNSKPDESILQPLLLINKYLRDYKSTHCTPLPEEDFAIIMSSINQHDKTN